VTDIGQDLDSSLVSVQSIVHDHLDYGTVCAHWIPQNLTDSHTPALSNVFDLAMKESIFSGALLHGMRRGLIT